MQVAEYIFSRLVEYGVKNVYMVSGGGAMFLNDALGREKRLRYICHHHEQAASIAAEGDARVTNRLAVVSVTTGPGGTNALTGLIGEWLDSIPVLFVSGQVKFSTTIASRPEIPLRQLGDQEINIVDMVRPVTKYAVMVTDPLRIRYELEKAVYLATTGRKGPTWLDIPINVQSAEIHPEELEGFEPPMKPSSVRSEVLSEIRSRLEKSRSPVIIGGHGIRLSDSVEKYREFLKQVQCPALGTFGGFDLLPTECPYLIGNVGTIGNRAANIALQSADFILCLGTRNNIRQMSYNYENFGKRAKEIVVVDIDQAELEKRTLVPTIPVQGDVGDFLDSLLSSLSLHPYSPLEEQQHWLKWCQEKKAKYSTVQPEHATVSSGVQPYYFGQKLTELLDEDAVVACANATPSLVLFQAGIIKSKQRMFANSGCAAMGYGFPASIGAALACAEKGRQIVCLEGDGSLMMNLQEMQTIRHQNLPIKLFLFNNNEYASIRQTHDHFFQKRHTGCDNISGVTFPDWEKVAAAFDWSYSVIDNTENLSENIAVVLRSPTCHFCNVLLSPNYTFSPKLSSRQLADGTIQSASLEDMSPFLSSEEMKSNYYPS